MSEPQQYQGKSQPVVVLGLITIALGTAISGLVILFKDNPQIMLVLGIVGVVANVLNAVKDQYVKGVVTPYVDVASYVNQSGDVVAGPASPLPNGIPADTVALETVPEDFEIGEGGGL